MKSFKYLVVLVCMAFASISLFAQEKELQTESDGFKWYKLEQNGKRGAQSASGATLIPLTRGYTYITYESKTAMHDGWFSVEKNSSMRGACDITGREIIAPGRYDWIEPQKDPDGYEHYYVERNGRMGACDKNGQEIIAPKYDHVSYWSWDGCFGVELNGKKGACDINGREIITPKYNSLVYFEDVFQYKDSSGKWVSTGVKLEKSSSSAYASSSTTGGSSSSSSGGKSGGGTESGLLYRGRYTETDHVWPAGNSMNPFFPQKEIRIYEDKMEVDDLLSDGNIFNSRTLSFQNVQSGKRVYNDGNEKAVVDGNFNISCTDSFGSSYKYLKDGSSMPQSGYYGGGGTGTYTGGNTGNDGNKGNTTTTQTKQHKCGVCGGTGREIRTDAASFGKTKYCSECGKTVPDYHYHAPCRSCGGKGWW